MEKQDYYKTLEVTKDASDADIKSSFRKLSRKYHPDMQAGKSEDEKKKAEEKFKEIAEAYEVLSDKDKRANYDNFGFAGNQSGSFSGGVDINEFLRRHAGMFGGMFSQGFDPFGFSSMQQKREFNAYTPEDGENRTVSINLTFKEAIFGVKKDFDLMLSTPCECCHGTGIKENTTPTECKRCGGTGSVTTTRQEGFYMSRIVTVCPDCQGTGYSAEKCPQCKGSKRKKTQKHICLNIPAGVDTGMQLCARGSGECGVCGGQNGNLFVIVNVEKSDVFKRSGLDLMVEQPLSPIIATLGGKIDVITPTGYTTLKIPAGTVSGKTFKEKGKGIKTSNSCGDLIIKILVEPFTHLSKNQEKLLQQFNETLTLDNLKTSSDFKSKCNAFLQQV